MVCHKCGAPAVEYNQLELQVELVIALLECENPAVKLAIKKLKEATGNWEKFKDLEDTDARNNQ